MNYDKLPDWKLERFVLGELSESELNHINELQKKDQVLKKRIKKIVSMNNQFFKNYPEEKEVAIIEKKIAVYNSNQKNIIFKQKLVFIPLAAAALFLVVFMFLFNTKTNNNKGSIAKNSDKNETLIKKNKKQNSLFLKKNVMRIVKNTNYRIRLKGKADRLFLYRQKGQAVEMLHNGSSAKQNDVIQLSYRIRKGKYSVIISIDGRGGVTLHYPSSINQYASRNIQNKQIFLKDAFQLDDAPRFERFFLVTSTKKFKVEAVLNQAHTLAKQPKHAKTKMLMPGKKYDQYSITLIKRSVQ